ncbi:helicase [Legionella qingyii]|uniref:Helicase n=1 Tax=Legionella qingyii TaxID=2184757 RepID=A0A317U5B7_9GAMM|nr:LirA/MavJ family T4SS effector [Legionella qingyii]PWY56007.1 helicase [Legionella qingyii]RUR22005.1 helicase [Legionella qingyii]RUR25587.1 helicase [Legionella qingyii]
MTIELIQTGKEDTNDYEQSLQDLGYTELDNHLKEDVIAIWKFFCNEELVFKGLKKFVTAYFAFTQHETKTLRQFFDEWGSKNHFNRPDSFEISEEFKTSPQFHYPKHTPVLYGELTPDLFNNILLKNGYLSADAGAGPKHGKWAHSIQFFLLEEARKEGILQLHAPTVCQFVQTISQIKGPFEALSLWDILFDSFEDHIFTHPNNITTILSSSWDTSEAAKFLAAKLIAFDEKFYRIARNESCYEAYAKQKYLSRLNEAHFIFYKEKCALLWFTPKDQKDTPTPDLLIPLCNHQLGS